MGIFRCMCIFVYLYDFLYERTITGIAESKKTFHLLISTFNLFLKIIVSIYISTHIKRKFSTLLSDCLGVHWTTK